MTQSRKIFSDSMLTHNMGSTAQGIARVGGSKFIGHISPGQIGKPFSEKQKETWEQTILVTQ